MATPLHLSLTGTAVGTGVLEYVFSSLVCILQQICAHWIAYIFLQQIYEEVSESTEACGVFRRG